MSSSNETIRKIPDSDWDFTIADFPGMKYKFELSEVENYEGEWEYRIHSPLSVEYHKRIDFIEFMRLKMAMKAAVEAFNNKDELFARIEGQKVIDAWVEHWGPKLLTEIS